MIEEVRFVIFGQPVPFARAGSFGKRRFTPPKQRDYMMEARRAAHEAMAGRAPLIGPLYAEVVALYEVPASWSKKMKAEAHWKTTRPDADNLAKEILDSIGASEPLAATDKLPIAIVYGDDAQVARLVVEKRYVQETPRVVVTVRRL